MKTLLTLIIVLISTPALSWDGYDWDTGEYIDIQRGELVRPNREIEVYNYGTGDYETYTVERIKHKGHKTEVEVYDYDKGEYRTFEMNNR